MKSKFIIITTVIALGLTACGGKSSNNQNTHNHENCTEHDHHTHNSEIPQQESFRVEADSTIIVTDTVTRRPHTHTHNGHTHTH